MLGCPLGPPTSGGITRARERLGFEPLRESSRTGTPVNMSSYRGKVMVLNIWGSWCGPCTAEAPTFEVAFGSTTLREWSSSATT